MYKTASLNLFKQTYTCSTCEPGIVIHLLMVASLKPSNVAHEHSAVTKVKHVVPTAYFQWPTVYRGL